jgi:TPR repeat protein
MRRVVALSVLLTWALAAVPPLGRAQGQRAACDLLTRADVEAVLGTTLEEPSAHSDGTMCLFSNRARGKPAPPKQISVQVLVNYAAAPDPAAVERYRKRIDETTYNNLQDLPEIGDAAVWWGSPQYNGVTVFNGGTMLLTVEGMATLEQVKALVLKALGGPGKTGYVYGTPRPPLPRPALAAAKPGSVDQLKRDLTAKADAGSVPAQLVLGKLYEFGTLAPDGAPKPDHAGAAYWYARAAAAGDLEATFRLGLLYRDGLGVPAEPATALDLLRRAAMADYTPAMVPLAYVYFALKTPVSPQRMTYWAQRAAEKNDPAGWTLTGYLWNKGWLGGGPPYYYKQAMEAYQKGAAGGDCVALMNIGGLYFNGDGVPQDRAQAQAWFQKAEACQGKDLDWMREKAAKYRQRAASGQMPAVQQPKTEAPRPSSGGKMTMSDAEKVFAGLLALLVIGAAMDVASGSSGDGGYTGGGSSSGGGSSTGGGGRNYTPPRTCRQVPVNNFSTMHGKGAISPGGATTTVCD